MTPPAMAPALVPPPSDEWDDLELLLPLEVWIHLVVAHWSQDRLTMVQVKPSSQAGQGGAEVSHLTQRLKMDRAERTNIVRMVIFRPGRGEAYHWIPRY